MTAKKKGCRCGMLTKHNCEYRHLSNMKKEHAGKRTYERYEQREKEKKEASRSTQ